MYPIIFKYYHSMVTKSMVTPKKIKDNAIHITKNLQQGVASLLLGAYQNPTNFKGLTQTQRKLQP